MLSMTIGVLAAIHGLAGDPGTAASFVLPATPLDPPATSGAASFGGAIGAVGDVNGDGFRDFVIGAPAAVDPADPQAGEGAIFLYFGSAAGIPLTPHSALYGNVANAHFGAVVCGAGDVDADGFDDVLIASPDFSDGQTDEGRVVLHRGSPAGLVSPPLWTFQSNMAGAKIGSILVPLGDVNGDGFADMGLADAAVALACAFYGSPAGFPSAPSWVYAVNGNGMGGMTASGDINDDGFDDILVAGFDAAGSNTSKAYLFRGSANGLLLAPSMAIVGASGCSGMRLGPGGDLNADGAPDAWVGDTCAQTLRSFKGKGGLLKQDKVLGKPIDVIVFPAALTGGHDGNGDGFDDAAVADPGSNDAYYFVGSKSGVNPFAVQHILPAAVSASAQFGTAIAFVGDVDLDGDSELAIGDPTADSGAMVGFDTLGQVFVYDGQEPNDQLPTEFRLGDRLEVSLDSVYALRTAKFDAVKGTKITLDFGPGQGQVVEVFIEAPSTADAEQWDSKVKIGPNGAQRVVKLNDSGRYGIGFLFTGGDPVAFAVQTSEKLPKKALARTVTVDLKNGESTSKVDALLLAGAMLDVSVVPSAALTDLEVGLSTPSGVEFPLGSFASGDLSAFSLTQVPAYAPGLHRIALTSLASGKTKLTITLTPTQPPAGIATIQLQ
jgi:FG-GAP repeat